ncbi:hypothetical protein BC829DRAFT_444736 [Chytridium lagenaria]|nr:hypothetical protein BC829DRAFT_444736 [Chytridium lagenaria]
MFPTLFPYGCGGPGENRERKLTLLQWIRRCLRVWGRQFATHYAFAAFAFDKVATQHAYRSLSCSMKVQRHAATDSQITSSVIDKALREIESYAVRSRHGLKGLTTEAADTVASIESLRRGSKLAVRGNAFAAASYFVACLNVVIDVIIGLTEPTADRRSKVKFHLQAWWSEVIPSQNAAIADTIR